MGMLRLLLALCVLTAHSPLGSMGSGGPLSVEGFFIISGFYMGLLLEGGRYPTVGYFYASRWWRLWPMFVLVAGVSFLARGMDWWALVRLQPLWLESLSQWGNVLMLGLDGVFYAEYHAAGTGLPGGTGHLLALMPQGWSLALEVMFVMLAPYLARQSTLVLAGIVVVTQGLRLLALQAGWDDTFWQYRFFGFECGMFVVGMLGYRMVRMGRVDRMVGAGLVAGFIAVLMGVQVWGTWFGPEMTRALWLGVMAVAVPVVFAATKDWRWDRWLGELSYPVYLWHWLVIVVCVRVIPGDHGVLEALVGLVVTLGLSIVCWRLVLVPFDTARHKWVRRLN